MPGDQYFDLDPPSRAIFLDDERHVWQVTWIPMPQDQSWTTVRSYSAFVSEIETNGIPAFISFDHDLGAEAYIIASGGESAHRDYYRRPNREMTGYDCAIWLVQYCNDRALPLPECQVHSMNPVGASNIRAVLEAARSRGP